MASENAEKKKYTCSAHANKKDKKLIKREKKKYGNASAQPHQSKKTKTNKNVRRKNICLDVCTYVMKDIKLKIYVWSMQKKRNGERMHMHPKLHFNSYRFFVFYSKCVCFLYMCEQKSIKLRYLFY